MRFCFRFGSRRRIDRAIGGDVDVPENVADVNRMVSSLVVSYRGGHAEQVRSTLFIRLIKPRDERSVAEVRSFVIQSL